MPDLSDLFPFNSGQVEDFYLLVLGQVQMYSAFHILINYYELTSCIENSVDPDQLASSDLHCLQEKPADQDPYCLQELIYIWFHTVFERINCLSTVRYKLICSFEQVKFLWTSTFRLFTCHRTRRKFYYFHTHGLTLLIKY